MVIRVIFLILISRRKEDFAHGILQLSETLIILEKNQPYFVQGCFFAKGFEILPIVKYHGISQMSYCSMSYCCWVFFFICYLILFEMLIDVFKTRN